MNVGIRLNPFYSGIIVFQPPNVTFFFEIFLKIFHLNTALTQ